MKQSTCHFSIKNYTPKRYQLLNVVKDVGNIKIFQKIQCKTSRLKSSSNRNKTKNKKGLDQQQIPLKDITTRYHGVMWRF